MHWQQTTARLNCNNPRLLRNNPGSIVPAAGSSHNPQLLRCATAQGSLCFSNNPRAAQLLCNNPRLICNPQLLVQPPYYSAITPGSLLLATPGGSGSYQNPRLLAETPAPRRTPSFSQNPRLLHNNPRHISSNRRLLVIVKHPPGTHTRSRISISSFHRNSPLSLGPARLPQG